jgi:hypothetical protein
MTRAVQQAAAKTRITTRKNILTPYLLQSVWPRCWVLLIYSGGINTNLHVAWQLTIRYHCCGGESYRLLIIAVIRSQSRNFHVSCDWTSYLLSICNLNAYCVDVTKVKVKFSLTCNENSKRGWNVALPPLLWHSGEVGRQITSCTGELETCQEIWVAHWRLIK